MSLFDTAKNLILAGDIVPFEKQISACFLTDEPLGMIGNTIYWLVACYA